VSEQHDWDALKSVFNAALELPAVQRERYLDSLDYPEGFIAQVRRLLDCSEDESDLDHPLPTGEAGAERPAYDLEGSEIGAYRVIQRIGSGGMGAVYLAEREQSGARQRVALKVLHRGLNDASAVERFQREKLILARLDHPSICRLLDSGVTAEGLPFFVMPYLEGGSTIVDYCLREGLSLAERVDLLVEVCGAVHYAHQNLVVHSDLKPANILVTAGGHVQLLDFGVSRLLTPEQAGLTQQLGLQRPLTPDYASPEQLEGRSPTTSSDVYALGVVLFEMLLGRKPYELDTAELIPQWKEQIGLPTASSLRGQLPSDLYTICSKAMRPEIEGRYGSAMALAEDLQRWRSGHPVRARRPSAAYRLTRFLHRNKWPVALASVSLISLLVLTGLTTVNALKQARQAEFIALERDRAEAAAQFWADLMEQTDPANAQSSSDSVDELLRTALERLRGDLDLPPVARVRLLSVLSTSWWHRAEPDQALEAARIAADAASRIEDQPVARAVAYRQLANIHGSRAEVEPARQAVDRALEALAAIDDPSPALQAQVLDADALILDMEDRTDQAARRLEQVVELQRKLPIEAVRVDHATALGNLAYMYYRLADQAEDGTVKLERAADLVNRSIELLRDEFGPRHPRIAFMLNAAGVIHRQNQDLAASLTAFEQAEEIATSYLPPGHDMLTRLRQNMGSVLHQLGDYQGAAAAYRKAYELAELPAGHPDVVQPFIRLMHNLYLAGGLDDAGPVLEDMQGHLDVLPEDHAARLWWQLMTYLQTAPMPATLAPERRDAWLARARAANDPELEALLEAL
jgi:serine/threonine-protein kinase